MEEKLLELKEQNLTVGLVAGSGVLWIVELVKDEKNTHFIKLDRNTRHEVNQSTYAINIVGEKGLETGVLIGGFMSNTLRLDSSLNISKADIDKAMNALD